MSFCQCNIVLAKTYDSCWIEEQSIHEVIDLGLWFLEVRVSGYLEGHRTYLWMIYSELVNST